MLYIITSYLILTLALFILWQQRQGEVQPLVCFLLSLELDVESWKFTQFDMNFEGMQLLTKKTYLGNQN
jgi:hypothetical protein